MARIFISYSRVDQPFVDDFVPLLHEVYGYESIWFDAELHGGEIWWNEILNQIARCDIFVFLLSNEALASHYCIAELEEARRLGKRILPVQIRARTSLPEPLSNIQLVDLSRGVRDVRGMNRFHAAIQRQMQQIPAQPSAPTRTDPVIIPVIPTSEIRRPRPSPSRGLLVAGAAGVLSVTAGVLLLLSSGIPMFSVQPTATTESTQVSTIAASDKSTDSPIERQAILYAATDPLTDEPSHTPTPLPTSQPSPTLTLSPTTIPPSQTPTLTSTATRAPTITPTIDIALVVATLDAQSTAVMRATNISGTMTQAVANEQATHSQIAGLTATAALWTPTPDITVSVEIYLTQRAAETVAAIVQELTAMAALATDTPVPTQVTASDTPTAVPHQGERIAFVSKQDGNDEIYVMNMDGSQLIRLTSNQHADFYLDWSAANSKIAFVSNRDGNNEIYSMNTDGSDQKRLTDNAAHDYAPAWSPDGSQIAFTTGRTGSWEIYIMSSNGANLTRLTENNVEDWNPAFSPDGTRIAFTSNRDGNWEIYTMNRDGSNLKRLTDHPSEDNAPVWSPDGSRIAFYSERDGNFEIYVMNADGSNPTRLTHNSTDDLGPAWSPDGSRLAFYSDRDGDDEIYIMNADGSDVTQVTNNSFDDRSPVWIGP